MPALPLSFPADSFTLSAPEELEESRTERLADALFNELRSQNQSALLRNSGIAPLLVALSWLNRQFWAGWTQQVTLFGRPTHGQWILMVLAGQFSRPLTHLFGRSAERAIERRRAALPKDHAHALGITDPRLLHLSLIAVPIGLTIAGRTEIVEFAHVDGETHVLWGDRSACLWIAASEDGDLLALSNISTAATDVVRRAGCIEVTAGSRSSHVSDASLANILEEMDLGKRDVLSSNIESTSISTNAAQTVRFELLS